MRRARRDLYYQLTVAFGKNALACRLWSRGAPGVLAREESMYTNIAQVLKRAVAETTTTIKSLHDAVQQLYTKELTCYLVWPVAQQRFDPQEELAVWTSWLHLYQAPVSFVEALRAILNSRRTLPKSGVVWSGVV